MVPEKIIQFPEPRVQNGGGGHAVVNGDGVKYFTETEIKLIRRTARNRAELAMMKKRVTAVREWMAIDLISSTGLRVTEASNVRCGDIHLEYGRSEIYVRFGKGSKSRTVQMPQSLKKHLKKYMEWKKDMGEATGYDDHLFMGQKGHWTRHAIQFLVKKYLKKLGLYENGKSVHALRHSYAVQLYRKEKDLRAVQKQLGHSSIQTTQIYADVTIEDIQQQIKNFWG